MKIDPASVCTLPPDDLSQRLAWVRREILPHAVTVRRLEEGLALELQAAPGMVEKVDRLIELEQACCAPIRFERVAGEAPGQIRLVLYGVDPDGDFFAGIAAV